MPEIDQIELKQNTDIFIIRYSECVPVDTRRSFIQALGRAAVQKGINRKQPIVLVAGNITLEQLSEEQMNQHGWYKKEKDFGVKQEKPNG